ncbi:MAG: hypothetical protein GTO45_38335 [Candidatus Aminicenantes bacterium]|nr:hypothetical protein [Candidatus Aminicenantes bacterium]NIM84484.1 hypothetical protein [Candidatus Aminicenantes bacterium]NIN24005.1 hypothetical protein [Candidatus Aminicenantes bacterium]NIN47719.1 hypothetical protein [Candidatus Aminicenantes bacterium]NIN90649.1 hypothetical protein [Candidatus Aminicenantes bacterium]
MSKLKGLLLCLLVVSVSVGLVISSTTSRVMGPMGEGAVVNRTQLNFGMIQGHNPEPQTFAVNMSGTSSFEWNITDNMDWLVCTPFYGATPATVTARVLACQKHPGQYTGTITVSDDYDPTTPQTIDVNLNVYSPGTSSPPFGSFDTPEHNSTVRSSVPVTGWVLDDVEVEKVQIWRGETGSLTYIGDAVQVEGARPDVEQAYPDYPNNYKAGWGYMMLTNFLPNGGNGTYRIHAIATDKEGYQTTLGSKTIICDNANAVKPFGAIDAPAQGGTASGSSYINWGWALTPQPKHIPTDGSTINVYVDSVPVGRPHYNNYRKDIAELFPDLANSDGAVGYFYFDTTGYADGVHTIYWTATDNEGRTDGIGSRYFTIDNTGDERAAPQAANHHKTLLHPYPQRYFHVSQLVDIPVDDMEPIGITRGFRKDNPPERGKRAEKGIFNITIKELERLVIDLSGTRRLIGGYMISGNRLDPLPIGSTLDIKNRKYYWLPGPGFFGEYRLVFIFKERGQQARMKKYITVKIEPKFE